MQYDARAYKAYNLESPQSSLKNMELVGAVQHSRTNNPAPYNPYQPISICNQATAVPLESCHSLQSSHGLCPGTPVSKITKLVYKLSVSLHLPVAY